MDTIKLQAYAWISGTLGTADNQNQTLKIQLDEGASLFDLFVQVANQYPEFKDKVFDPQSGKISDQVMIISNGRLIQLREFSTTFLKDNDTVVLSPLLVGG